MPVLAPAPRDGDAASFDQPRVACRVARLPRLGLVGDAHAAGRSARLAAVAAGADDVGAALVAGSGGRDAAADEDCEGGEASHDDGWEWLARQ